MTPVEAIEYCARAVVSVLTEQADGPLNQWRVLLGVARGLGCEVHGGYEVETSYYPVPGLGFPSGIALIDMRGEASVCTLLLLHELAHHVMAWWDDWQIKTPAEVVDALGAVELAEDRICRRASELAHAVPRGLQWNGKLATLRGTVIRWPDVRPIPSFLSMPAAEIDEFDRSECVARDECADTVWG